MPYPKPNIFQCLFMGVWIILLGIAFKLRGKDAV